MNDFLGSSKRGVGDQLVAEWHREREILFSILSDSIL